MIEKIDSNIIDNIDNLELKDYFIMPYYSFNSLVYITISKSSIEWYNNNLKRITGYKRIENALKKIYASSKFYGYEITVIGFLTTTKKKKTLVIFDLLLKDEINKKIQSKKYSIRLDNIKNRFINLVNNKLVLSVFAQKNISDTIDDITLKMIESNSWDGLIFYKDKPYNFEIDNSSLLFYKVWEIKTGIITGFEFGTNSDNKPCVTSLFVFNEELNNNIKICGNLAEVQKIDINELDERILNKKILFKYCVFDVDGKKTILTNFLKFE